MFTSIPPLGARSETFSSVSTGSGAVAAVASRSRVVTGVGGKIA